MRLGAGNDMIGALGAEIDRLEAEIRQLVPGVRHIDLVGCGRACLAQAESGSGAGFDLPADDLTASLQETDRGRHDKGTNTSSGLYTVESESSGP